MGFSVSIITRANTYNKSPLIHIPLYSLLALFLWTDPTNAEGIIFTNYFLKSFGHIFDPEARAMVMS